MTSENPPQGNEANQHQPGKFYLGEHLHHLNMVDGSESHFAANGFSAEDFKPQEGKITNEQVLVLSFFSQEARNIISIYKAAMETYTVYKDKMSEERKKQALEKIALYEPLAVKFLTEISALLPTLTEVATQINEGTVGSMTLEERRAELQHLEAQQAAYVARVGELQKEYAIPLAEKERIFQHQNQLRISGLPDPLELTEAFDANRLALKPYSETKEPLDRGNQNILKPAILYYTETRDLEGSAPSADASRFVSQVTELKSLIV